ncbi:histidine kinase N-terminal 7TM domain-containing diguanylate cyclase [Paenibacillus sp. GXUN7292]|uniref:histidine kinase N-terminal 7TM domain-containing diguanylate cyclase n=1 Tax=Paenibacillus sp. GXUN7292 TaxID=3422499 RepID=UPI003D7D9234
MDWIIWIDLSMFLVLLGLFVYVFSSSSITALNRIYLLLHMVFMVWPLTQFALQASSDILYKKFYLVCSYIGLSMLGFAWFIFILYLTGRTNIFRKGRAVLLALPALASIAAVIWNPQGIFVSIKHAPEFGKQLDSGPLFWYMIAQLLLYMLASSIIMVYCMRKEQSPRYRQMIKTAMIGMMTLLAFSLIDLLLNVVYKELFLSYIPFISIGLTVAACYIVFAVTRNRVFDIIQIVQRDVMNTMSMGIIVLDEYNMVIDMNRVLKSYLRLRIGDIFSEDLLAAQLKLGSRVQFGHYFAEQRKRPMKRIEFQLELEMDETRYIIVQSAPILDPRKKIVGRVITFQNITEMRKLVEETNRQNTLLQERNKELLIVQDELYRANKKLEYMAITDGLTGCYNRRYLMQQLEDEIAVKKYSVPFSIFIFDLDHFKRINDSYGHLIGDEILCSTVDAVRSVLRPADVLARYGGEEFMVYLPRTSHAQAMEIAHKIRGQVENNTIMLENSTELLSVTISMGVISIDEHTLLVQPDSKLLLRELVHEADAALYEAKFSGRNRVVERKLASTSYSAQ